MERDANNCDRDRERETPRTITVLGREDTGEEKNAKSYAVRERERDTENSTRKRVTRKRGREMPRATQ